MEPLNLWNFPQSLWLNQQINSSKALHPEVSFGKILNPEMPLIEKVLPIDALYEHVYEWVNVKTVLYSALSGDRDYKSTI